MVNSPAPQQNAHRGEARSPEFRIRRQGGFIAVPRWRRNRRRDTLTSRKSFRKMASCTARRGTSARHVGKKCRENADLSDGSVEPVRIFFSQRNHRLHMHRRCMRMYQYRNRTSVRKFFCAPGRCQHLPGREKTFR